MRGRKPTNFLEAAERNRRKTVLLIALFILLSVAGGAGVDATLMTGLGEYWFSLFGVVALALLLPLWTLSFVARVRSFYRNGGVIDEFGYEIETSWLVAASSCIPFVGIALMFMILDVSRGDSFTILGVIEAKNGVIFTTIPVATFAGFIIGTGGAY